MKKLSNYIITSAILAGLASCDKNITDYNVNGKLASNVPSVNLFTAAEKAFVDYNTSTGVGVAPFRVLSQEWTENTYVYEANYNFAAYNANQNWWNRLYGTTGSTTPGVLANLDAAKNKFASDVKNPVSANNDRIIADILEVYTYSELVNTYGDVPYSEALNPVIPYPKYDDAKTIYSDLLTRLDTCITGLDVSGESLGDADQIYGGDVTLWKKFAATLKLKLALVLGDVDASTASKSALEAVQSGVFTSNSDNASMTYDVSSPSNSNPIWQALVNSGRHDFVPAGYLVNTMLSWSDPRLPLYFTKYKGTYSGGTPGGANGYGLYSDFAPALQEAAYPGTVLDYAETEFLLAEAVERGIAVGGTAQSHYNNAITASILFWGGTASDATTYLANSLVNYTTAAGTWKQKIGYQKWIANYNKNWDSWTDIRRYGYPNLDVVSKPLNPKTSYPLRFTYPSTESGSNSTNWAAAVAKITGGEDVVTAKLFWMQ